MSGLLFTTSIAVTLPLMPPGPIFLGLIFSSGAHAFFKKDVKAYLCNYQEGIFNNPDLGKTGDPCLEGGTSKYKFYIGGKLIYL